MTPPYTLAVFTKNRVNPAYAAARLAADRVAAEAGARTVHYVPATPDDVGQQKALVGEALAAAPDAVVFVPVDDRRMVPDVARFAAAGIPVVVCINRMDGEFVSFVGSDDVAVGYTAARALIDSLGGAGRIVAIEGTPVAPTSRDRTVGLRKALAETPAVKLLGSGVGYFQQAPARAEMARLIAEHPEIDGVWTSNDVMAFGALEALAAAGRSAKVVGVNGLPEAIENIERGAMQASVDFSAFNIAGIAAHAAVRHLRGEAVPAVDHGASRVDRPDELSALESAVRPPADARLGRGRGLGILSAMRTRLVSIGLGLLLLAAGAAAQTRPAPPAAPAPSASSLIDLNTASRDDLMSLEGIGEVRADAIIRARPFKAKTELVERRLIPEALYDKIADKVMARPPPGTPPTPTTRPPAGQPRRT